MELDQSEVVFVPKTVEFLREKNAARIAFFQHLINDIESKGRIYYKVKIINNTAPRDELTLRLSEAVEYCTAHDGEKLYNEQVVPLYVNPPEATATEGDQ